MLVYRITGRQGWLRVPRQVCPECDLTVAAVQAAVARAGLPAACVEVRPWLCHLPAAVLRGAWHPPAVLIDGRVACQGRVPNIALLVARLRAGGAGDAGAQVSGDVAR